MIKSSQSESKAAEPAAASRSIACWNEDAQTQALRVELKGGDFFVFPVSHFLCAEFTRGAEGDLLRLAFTTHEVKIRGRHLREVALALQRLAVEWIREIVPKYAALAGPDAAIIMAIEVAALADAASSGGEQGRD
ncbi:MAG: hypothetical protein ABIP20_04175 [Chthoniobacteraceae bacterium]